MNKSKKLVLIAVVWIFSFILLADVSAAWDGLEVTGTTYSEKGESFAIVNNEVFKVGDKIGEAELIEIREGAVKFKKGGRIFTKTVVGSPQNSTAGFSEYSFSSDYKFITSRIFENYKWGTHIDAIKKELIRRNKNIINVSDHDIEYQDKLHNQNCRVLLQFGPNAKLLHSVSIAWEKTVCGILKKELTDKYGPAHKSYKDREAYLWGYMSGYDSVSLDCASGRTRLDYSSPAYVGN